MIHRDVCLEALAYELPPNVVSTDSLFLALEPTLSRIGLPSASLQALCGVLERRFWNRGTELASAAASAARKALGKSGLRPEQIGCLVNTSVCKDYIEPSTASLVHGELGLADHCLNFDLGNACLAFLNGLSVVSDMIEKGQIEAGMVVDAESSRDVTEATVQRLLAPDVDADRFAEHFAALTLGSGAVAAVLVNRQLSRTGHGIVGHVALSDTRYNRLCLGKPTEMVTDQKNLLSAGVELGKRTWDLARRAFGWTCDNVAQFITHQVGVTHHRAICAALGIDLERSFVTYPFLGNVGPASVPLTLALAEERNLLRRGDRVALLGIGSGLNCSMMEVQW